MSSKKQSRNLRRNKADQKSGLSRHYHEIWIKAVTAATQNWIKAVAAATQKSSTASLRARDSVAINRKRKNPEGGHNE
jgi:hypothetical protein